MESRSLPDISVALENTRLLISQKAKSIFIFGNIHREDIVVSALVKHISTPLPCRCDNSYITLYRPFCGRSSVCSQSKSRNMQEIMRRQIWKCNISLWKRSSEEAILRERYYHIARFMKCNLFLPQQGQTKLKQCLTQFWRHRKKDLCCKISCQTEENTIIILLFGIISLLFHPWNNLTNVLEPFGENLISLTPPATVLRLPNMMSE